MPNAASRIVGPQQFANATATLYTVPASTLAKINYIQISNPGAAATFTLCIGADAAAKRIYDAYSIGAGQVLTLYPFIPLAAAEILTGFASVASQVVIEVSAILNTVG
jgi:hypothetical protein